MTLTPMPAVYCPACGKPLEETSLDYEETRGRCPVHGNLILDCLIDSDD